MNNNEPASKARYDFSLAIERFDQIQACLKASNELTRTNNFDANHLQQILSDINSSVKENQNKPLGVDRGALNLLALEMQKVHEIYMGCDANACANVMSKLAYRTMNLMPDDRTAKMATTVILSDFASATGNKFDWTHQFNQSGSGFSSLSIALDEAKNGEPSNLRGILISAMEAYNDPDRSSKLNVAFTDLASSTPENIPQEKRDAVTQSFVEKLKERRNNQESAPSVKPTQSHDMGM